MEAGLAVDIGKNTRFSSDGNGDGTAREAGIASGKARRNKKSLQALAQALLESGGGLTEAQKDELKALGMEPTQGAALVQAMHQKALKGSERAAEFVRDTSGQKPETQAHITLGEGLSPAEIRGLTDEELQSILDGD